MLKKANYLYGEDVVHAYPDGWSCVSCGAEFTEKTIDVECLYVIETKHGTECLKCSREKQAPSHKLQAASSKLQAPRKEHN